MKGERLCSMTTTLSGHHQNGLFESSSCNGFSFTVVTASVCICAYVCVYVCVRRYACAAGFSLAVEFIDLATPSGQQALGSSYLDLWHWDYRYMPLHLAFCMCSGIRSSCLCSKYFLATSSWSYMIGLKLAIGLKLLLCPRKL